MTGFEKIIEESGYRHNFITEKIGMPVHRFSYIKVNPNSITPEELPILADFFKIPIEEFIARINEQVPEPVD